MINAIIYAATTIQFPGSALRDADQPPELVQASSLASDGSLYCYNKALHYRIPRRLVYAQVPDAVVTALRTLYATLSGGRYLFTWFDHVGQGYYSQDYISEDYLDGGHACRFTAAIRHTPTGANRNRVELDLEELLPLAAPSVASWSAATTAASGTFPCWLFRLTVAGIDYWLSDHAFMVEGWNGQNYTTLPWVKTWGNMQGAITGNLDEYKVSDFSVDLLIDPDATPNLRTLANTYELEQYPVELYLWFHGLTAITDPPRLKWRGYVRNHPEMDDTTLRLDCEDESARLSKNLGTLLDVRTYPDAAKADVGKVIPILFGSVRGLPLLGINVGPQTTLPAAISASTAAFDVSDATDLDGAVIVIDDEHMQVTSFAGNTIGVNRGINATLPASHSRGAVVWEFRDEYLYACETVDSISQIYGKNGEHYINITAICTLYTGRPGSQHPAYPGLAVVSLPGLVTLDQLANLGLADTTNVLDTIGINDGILLTDGIYVSSPWVANAPHSHSVAIDTNQTSASCPVTRSQVGNFAAISFVNPVVTRSRVVYAITVTLGNPVWAAHPNTLTITIGAYSYSDSITWSDTSPGGVYPGKTFTYNLEVFGGDMSADSVTVNMNWGSGTTPVTVNSATRTISTSSSGAATVNSTASGAVKTGTITRPGTVTKTGGANKTGVISLIGTTSLKSVLSLSIYGDLTRNVYLPAAVEQDILTRADGSTLTTVGTFPAAYRLDGAITEYKPAQYWLDYFAFQCRAWFVKSCGVARLIVRPDTLTSIKTLPNCLLNGNKRSLKISKAPLSEVINVMALRYDRDWSQARNAANYKGCVTQRMEESIGYYGERTGAQAEMFWFDFVRDPNMAIAVMGYYLYKHSRRHRLYHFNVALDSEALQFADAITLGFEGNKQVEIVAADLTPGDKSRLDTLTITASDIHTEWPYFSSTDYYSEDYLLSHL